MKTNPITMMTRVALTTLLCGYCAFAANHKILNGTWTLTPTKSDFAGQPVVQSGTVTISDHDGVAVVSRSFKYEGATETFFYSDSAASDHTQTIHAGKDFKSKTRWDDDVLKVTTTQSGAVTVESYSLASDGSMIVTVERPQAKPITLVFQRQ
jgi:hypothetical protein